MSNWEGVLVITIARGDDPTMTKRNMSSLKRNKSKKSPLKPSKSNKMLKSNNYEESIHDHRWNDTVSMGLLLVLYTLQGIPMGLCGSIPLILKERQVSYEGLSLFSLVSFPFSLKILWAPIVDCFYIPSIGRRKTWLIPVQLLTGLVMILGSPYVSLWIGDQTNTIGNSNFNIDITSLVVYFFFLYFLMATQDIAVDGWALTMLSRENVGYASLCNSIGQSLGVFLANQGFIALSDPEWCKVFLGIESIDSKPILTLDSFMRFWGVVFIFVTIVVWFGKSEVSQSSGVTVVCASTTSDTEGGISDYSKYSACSNGTQAATQEPEGFVETIKQLRDIFKLPLIHSLAAVLLTCKVAFSAADSVSNFKLQENGLPKTELSMISPLLMIVGFVVPVVAGRLISQSPVRTLIAGINLKLLTSFMKWGMVQACQVTYSSSNLGLRYVFFYTLVLVMVVHEAAGNLVFISFMTFFSQVSDANIGGTYMTLLNTLANLGSIWPSSLALWLLPKLDRILSFAMIMGYRIDGYTAESFGCVLIGLVWLRVFRQQLIRLEQSRHGDWKVSGKTMID